MTQYNQKQIELSAKEKTVILSSFCTPAQIESLSFDKFVKHAQYNPIISKKESLIKASLQKDANLTLSFTPDKEIVAFSILQYTSEEERWIRVGKEIMMEVSVIEVSRAWRSMGIAKPLLSLGTDHPLKEDKIFYMVGYSWTWDLEGTVLTSMQYRDKMIKLFSSCGFKILQTNEPNIMLRPENLFMARIGTNISLETEKKFKMVRFNLDL